MQALELEYCGRKIIDREREPVLSATAGQFGAFVLSLVWNPSSGLFWKLPQLFNIQLLDDDLTSTNDSVHGGKFAAASRLSAATATQPTQQQYYQHSGSRSPRDCQQSPDSKQQSADGTRDLSPALTVV